MMITSVPLRSHKSNIRHFPDGLVCPGTVVRQRRPVNQNSYGDKVVGIERLLHHLRLLWPEWGVMNPKPTFPSRH